MFVIQFAVYKLNIHISTYMNITFLGGFLGRIVPILSNIPIADDVTYSSIIIPFGQRINSATKPKIAPYGYT